MLKISFSFLAILILITSCSKKIRQESYNNGYKSGHEQGKIVGTDEGIEIGKKIAIKDIIKEYYKKQRLDNSIKFINSDYQVDLNYNDILSSLDIEKEIDQDFAKCLFQIHKEIINSFANKLNLNETQTDELITFYSEIHPIVSREYGKEFINYKNIKELKRDPNKYIEFNNYNNAEILSKIVSSNICSLFGLISSAFLKKIPEIAIAGFYAGGFCEDLLSGIVFSITSNLIEQGYIKDLEYSKTSIQSLGMEMIAELATVEAKYTITMHRERIIKLLDLDWLKSTAHISATYVGFAKAGFDLKEQFEIRFDHTKHLMIVTMPEPQIFPPIVYPEINLIENGWFATIDPEMINRMHSAVVLDINSKALNDNILDMATQSGISIIESILKPALQIPPEPYTIKVEINKNQTK